jgi:hypothetical protein
VSVGGGGGGGGGLALVGGVDVGALGGVCVGLEAVEEGAVGPVLEGLDVGAAFVWLGLGVGRAGLPLDVADVGCPGAAGVTEIGAVHDTVYFAGLEAAATGLVTTSTASPDAGSAGGVIVSGGRVFVPAPRKVTVRAAESCPSASAQ